MPILDALTRGIPVVALDSTVNRELLSLTGSDGLFLVKEHSEMRAVVERLLVSRASGSAPADRGPGGTSPATTRARSRSCWRAIWTWSCFAEDGI